MKGLIKIVSNSSKWGGQKPDPLPKLIGRLAKLTLEPYSSAAELVDGTRQFWGNFVEESAVFEIYVKRDSDADRALLRAFRGNKAYRTK